MLKLFLILLLSVSTLPGQYKREAAGAPPAELAASIQSLMAKDGHKILAPDGKVYCEVWFVIKPPVGPLTSENDVTWKTTPPGAVIGAIRWPGPGSDRRGQGLKPGVYTLRFSMFPVNGDHQGVAPQRDFLLMTPAAEDKDAAAVSVFDDLVAMSRKSSGTPHPAVLSMWKVEGDFTAGLAPLGETDWVLNVKIGDVPIALILVGKTEG